MTEFRNSGDKMDGQRTAPNEYVVIKALENGVNIIGLTSGRDTKFHHTEKLDKGEVFLAEFTEMTTAMKINGKAEIYTRHGKIISDTE